MNDKLLLRIGGIGTVVIAICCVTPVLVVALGAVGLSAWIGGLDTILFPLLAIFLLITIVAGVRLSRHRTTDR